MPYVSRCIACGAEYPPQRIRASCDCGGLLDVVHAPSVAVSRELFDERLNQWDPENPLYRSGVWRFRELVLPVEESAIVSRPRGTRPCTGASASLTGSGQKTSSSSTRGRTPPARSRTGG